MRFLFALCFLLLSCGPSPAGPSDTTPKDSQTIETTSKSAKRILFFGDSLTAGYGLLDYEMAWPHIVTKRLNAEGFDYSLTNAGISGDTTSGGLGRLDWVLQETPDIFVLELGANDMLRGITPDVTKENLRKMIQIVKTKAPKAKILLVGMIATPNLGKKYAGEFNAIYPNLAKEEKVPLVPFLLEKVAAKRKLNQKDGIHPTEEGHVLVAETVYPYLKELAGK
ncbi:MAG: arylesterase [Leptospira sp.]|nr:arylesterase [Leptospira sp.]